MNAHTVEIAISTSEKHWPERSLADRLKAAKALGNLCIGYHYGRQGGLWEVTAICRPRQRNLVELKVDGERERQFREELEDFAVSVQHIA